MTPPQPMVPLGMDRSGCRLGVGVVVHALHVEIARARALRCDLPAGQTMGQTTGMTTGGTTGQTTGYHTRPGTKKKQEIQQSCSVHESDRNETGGASAYPSTKSDA